MTSKTMPIRIQLSRKKGSRLPANTVSVARPSRWGNPFRVGDIHHSTGERIADVATAVRLFEAHWFNGSHEENMAPIVRDELRGKNLACWCKPGTPCHADVLLRVANE